VLVVSVDVDRDRLASAIVERRVQQLSKTSIPLIVANADLSLRLQESETLRNITIRIVLVLVDSAAVSVKPPELSVETIRPGVRVSYDREVLTASLTRHVTGSAGNSVKIVVQILRDEEISVDNRFVEVFLVRERDVATVR